MMSLETFPGKDNWMTKKPMGMKALMGQTSERIYNKEYCIEKIRDNLSPFTEGSMAKNLPIDMLHDFKIHFKGLFRIRYRGKTDYSKRYFRSPHHCLQKYATSFAIYPLSEQSYKEIFKRGI